MPGVLAERCAGGQQVFEVIVPTEHTVLHQQGGDIADETFAQRTHGEQGAAVRSSTAARIANAIAEHLFPAVGAQHPDDDAGRMLALDQRQSQGIHLGTQVVGVDARRLGLVGWVYLLLREGAAGAQAKREQSRAEGSAEEVNTEHELQGLLSGAAVLAAAGRCGETECIAGTFRCRGAGAAPEAR